MALYGFKSLFGTFRLDLQAYLRSFFAAGAQKIRAFLRKGPEKGAFLGVPALSLDLNPFRLSSFMGVPAVLLDFSQFV